MSSPWDPKQYTKFKDERAQPFHDLLNLVRPIPGGHAIDLGCGTGELTKIMHERLGASATLGIDSSSTMLAESNRLNGPGLSFSYGEIANYRALSGFDVVFSNAALQWLPDHPKLFPRIAALVRPGGQLAIQMPDNNDHPSHVIAHAVAAQEPFRSALGGYIREWPVMPTAWYAELLDALGFEEQNVHLRVYGHHLESREAVVEWVKGTLLNDYKQRMPADLFADYLVAYHDQLMPRLEAREPYFYAFKRVLIWGRKAVPAS